LRDLSEYYRLWSRQILREFQGICYQYKLALEPPIFAISESKTRLGAWFPETREIRISSFLIRNHSWDITLQVLKHEIAHQICWEIYGDCQGGHGRNFQKACLLLGLPEKFCHSRGDLTVTVEKEGGDTDHASRKVVEKIRKLLALAQSSNEHESALAMHMAKRLLDRHNLTEIAADHEERFVYCIINRKQKRISEYQRHIIVIIKKYFQVEAICASLYDPVADAMHKTFELFGHAANVQTAEYCYDFLETKLAWLWEQRRVGFTGNARIARKSYYLGLIKGFAERLETQGRGSQPADGNPAGLPLSSVGALVPGDQAPLHRFIRSRYPRLACRSFGSARIYKETYEEGIQTGRALVFHKGIAGCGENIGKLLE
jgi:hypothetical protein